jgi:hypothetical protein
MVVLTYYIKYTGGGMPYYIYNPIRVGIHIACIRKEKGVDQFIARTRSYTIDCIYLYLIYVDIIRAPIWGALFSI